MTWNDSQTDSVYPKCLQKRLIVVVVAIIVQLCPTQVDANFLVIFPSLTKLAPHPHVLAFMSAIFVPKFFDIALIEPMIAVYESILAFLSYLI